MQRLFILLFVANLIVNAVSLFVLPSTVAIHFAAGGEPDSWASAELNALLFTMLELFLFYVFWSLPSALNKTPARWISLPNKEYWLKKDNRQLMLKKFSRLMNEFGAALFLFLLTVNLLAIDANLSEPVRLNVSIFMTVFIVFMLYVVYWTIKILRSFRVPDSVVSK